MAALKCVPVLLHNADFIFWSFGICYSFSVWVYKTAEASAIVSLNNKKKKWKTKNIAEFITKFEQHGFTLNYCFQQLDVMANGVDTDQTPL